MKRVRRGLVGLSCFLLSCGGDSGTVPDGGASNPPENTAAPCQDGRDNDADGFADCADQDCWPLTFCAAQRPDGWQPPTDGGPAPADGFFDAPFITDGGPRFDTGLQSCTIHYDCQQGEFCYKKRCLRDKQQAVYHCGKKDAQGNDTCPPGHWCLSQANTKEQCAESTTYVCQDACDCGPAHCCIDVPSLGNRSAGPALPDSPT